MITILGMALDLAEKGEIQKANDLLWYHTPIWQIKANWEDVQEICDQGITPSLERRRCNGLNIEIGFPLRRCLMRSPDGLGLRWYLSGGSVTAYGICEKKNCPLLSEER